MAACLAGAFEALTYPVRLREESFLAISERWPARTELKATLKIRKLLILLNRRNVTNIRFAQPRYTPGTRPLEGAIEVERFLLVLP